MYLCTLVLVLGMQFRVQCKMVTNIEIKITNYMKQEWVTSVINPLTKSQGNYYD